ncbi:MAG: hypothetical protein IPH55_17205 [Betaproteobacteria bacterium]|nr:hypothetical protein [Betaproteobacteria bacterium]
MNWGKSGSDPDLHRGGIMTILFTDLGRTVGSARAAQVCRSGFSRERFVWHVHSRLKPLLQGILVLGMLFPIIGNAQTAPAAREAPASRDALFGDAPSESQDAKLSGFYEFTPAYTYGDPKHWSRAANRLAVDARGDLGSGVKWKLGARVDVDPVYMGSNFYLQDVKENQRVTAIWRENYLDFDAGGWDFRVGAQNIVWGDVVGLFFADVVSARDLRDFLLPSFDVIRIPQWAARAEYSTGDSHVELVWVPVQAFDNIGKPGSDFYPAPLPSPTPSNVAAVFQNPDRPSSSLGNSAYGFRANTLVGGWDIAGFYYRSFSSSPTFYRELTGVASQPLTYQPRYDRIWQAGATFSKDFGSMVLHGEAVYASGQNYGTLDSAPPNGVVSRSTVDWIASLDVPLSEIEGRTNFQVFQRIYLDGGDDAVALKSGSLGVSAFVSAKFGGVWEPQLLWIQTFGGGGGLVRPRLNWTPVTNTSLSAGVDIFTGSSDGYFGRYRNRDRVYVEVRYAF